LGTVWNQNNLVCSGEVGQPIEYRNLRRAFKRICIEAGVSEIRLYDLRHTAITLMAAAGGDLKAISEVAGHANVTITRNVYQHINKQQRNAVLATLTVAHAAPAKPRLKVVSQTE
jgi:integrase